MKIYKVPGPARNGSIPFPGGMYCDHCDHLVQEGQIVAAKRSRTGGVAIHKECMSELLTDAILSDYDVIKEFAMANGRLPLEGELLNG